MLTLDKAVQLYELLGSHIPEYNEGDETIDFIEKMVHSIRTNGTGTEYIEAVELMSGMPLETLSQFAPIEILDLFTESIAENQIISLKGFLDKVGYNG
jgi:hypothetical protein